MIETKIVKTTAGGVETRNVQLKETVLRKSFHEFDIPRLDKEISTLRGEVSKFLRDQGCRPRGDAKVRIFVEVTQLGEPEAVDGE